jgi:polar amino acid transport system permease protein
MPQLVLLFIVFFGSTRWAGINIDGELAAIIVFSLWGTAEMGDLVRGAIISIPKHQYESSEALGLTPAQTYFYIIIPQAVRRLIPLSINLVTRMIKTTSLILMIGVVEVLKVAQQIIEANRMSSANAAFGVYLTVFLLYFIVCWPISMGARVLEKRWADS